MRRSMRRYASSIQRQPHRAGSHNQSPPMRRAALSVTRDMMAQFNPCARLFVDCAARMRTSGIEEMRTAIRTDDDRLDSRRYNAPSAPEIAAIISEESAGKPRDIRLS